MQILPLAAGFLFLSSTALTFSDAARAAIDDASEAQALERSKQTLKYGPDELQNLDFWHARNADGPAPLVVFVHGGGWKRGSKDNATGDYKAEHYTAIGYNFASINYRLVPEDTVEDQARDVAAAVRALIDRARELGIDRSRIVLMGHSAGAHLVALVGTDPQYLKSAGLGMDDIDGIVPIDGAAYNVPEQMEGWKPLMGKTYRQAFGREKSRQLALSPTYHAASPNVDDFLILYVGRKDGIEQSEELGKALERAGTGVEYGRFDGKGLKGHAEINRELGNPDYAATPVVDAWLKRVFR